MFHYELNEPIKAVLAECWKLRRLGTENRVFHGQDGRALTVEGLKTGLRKLYARIARLEKAAEVPEEYRLKLAGRPCRVFRHTFRSRLIDRGVDRDLQRYLMGHGDRTMTDHYGAPSDARICKALRLSLYWDQTASRGTLPVARPERLRATQVDSRTN